MKLYNCRPSEVDEESAVMNDWMLALESAFNSGMAEKMRDGE